MSDKLKQVFGKLIWHFKVGQCATLVNREAPVCAMGIALLATVIYKITAGAVAHPNLLR
ncbi:MAG: hypothetical protein LW705_02590 [Comamonadaceae bacterium]|nr:hypothetical protein [Comamonadaceae bacterium]